MDTPNDVASEMMDASTTETALDHVAAPNTEWQDIFEIRWQNLEVLVGDAGSAAELARRTDSDPSYISQIRTRATYGRGVTRRVGEKFARRLEQAMGKPRGWMDISRTGAVLLPPRPASAPTFRDARIEDFRPGVYRHYKGNFYLAHGLAREDETNETVVVYTRLYARDGLPMSTRRLSVWLEDVEHQGAYVQRFSFAGQETP